MSDPIVTIRGLHKRFGDNEVLRGIDLDIDEGEVVCLIGPSGSGKSTLLRCVNLLEPPTSGTVSAAGHDMTDPDVEIDAARRDIGMVFQSVALLPNRTVLENTGFGLEVQGIGKAERDRAALAAPEGARP